MKVRRVAVVMCTFNEADGIREFLYELAENLSDFDTKFVVVDDCSTDATKEVLSHLVDDQSLNLEVVVNDKNLGHGPSTIRALSIGLSTGQSIVLSMDGDGQIIGSDARRMIEELTAANLEVVEGVRTNRRDPFFRKIVSWATRVLVWFRSGQFPSDANTPFRAYKREFLETLLLEGFVGATTPNLYISTFCRLKEVLIQEVHIQSIPRRGLSRQGTTWDQRYTFIPSRRFMQFCIAAAREWLVSRNSVNN